MNLITMRDLLPDPNATFKGLSEFIIGQDTAKKYLSNLILNRAITVLKLRKFYPSQAPINCANLLLIGPTGSGKTELMRSLSKVADIPISIFDISGVTSAGYYGGKVEDILISHIKECRQWVDDEARKGLMLSDLSIDEIETMQVQSGVVYIDEIDKIRCTNRGSKDIDINGDRVQIELLKILEGQNVNISNSKTLISGAKSVDTTNMFFVLGGAFSGLSTIIYNRMNKGSGIGFTSDHTTRSELKDDDSILKYVTTEDLIEYGFKPEFLGRVPNIAVLSELSVESMIKIITKPKESIYDKYKEFFAVFGVKMSMEKEAIEIIASEAIKLRIGARSLSRIFETVFKDVMFDSFKLSQKKELKITANFVSDRLGEVRNLL